MLIAQITDLHIGLGRTAEGNDSRLQQVVARLGVIDPDVVLATGDLTEDGDAPSYGRLAELLSPLSAPVLPVIGNHDLRPAFIHALGVQTDLDGFVQYVSYVGDLRIVVLDTVETGQHGAAFCERRAAWLSARLDEEPGMPTLIALHHPPVKCGIAWMDVGADGPWSDRLAPQSAGYRDGFRPRIIEEDPGFALHLWTDGQLITHFGTAGEHRIIAGLDTATGKMVADRPESR